MGKEYIAISGNIGAGKTTLCKKLSADFNLIVNEEDMSNPHISDFYNDCAKNAFKMQVRFLASRLEFLTNYSSDKPFLQDRTVDEESEIFVKLLHQSGYIDSKELDTYELLLDNIKSFLPEPILTIYLKGSVPTLSRRIAKRGREYEQSISIEYLSRLNDYYNEWWKNVKFSDGRSELMEINIDEIDFESDESQYEKICSTIKTFL